MTDLATLILAATALILGASALLTVNRLRPVAGRLVIGLTGILLTAYGSVVTVELAAPFVLKAALPAERAGHVVAAGDAALMMCT